MKKTYVDANIEIITVSVPDIMTNSDPGLDDKDWVLDI